MRKPPARQWRSTGGLYRSPQSIAGAALAAHRCGSGAPYWMSVCGCFRGPSRCAAKSRLRLEAMAPSFCWQRWRKERRWELRTIRSTEAEFRDVRVRSEPGRRVRRSSGRPAGRSRMRSGCGRAVYAIQAFVFGPQAPSVDGAPHRVRRKACREPWHSRACGDFGLHVQQCTGACPQLNQGFLVTAGHKHEYNVQSFAQPVVLHMCQLGLANPWSTT
eukprot:361377-Chlamydomonas_euryale.AAC.8